MLSTCLPSASSLSNRALAVLRLTIRSQTIHPGQACNLSAIPSFRSSSSTSTIAFPGTEPELALSDPLNPNIPLSPLGLPLHPLPLPPPSTSTSTPITREALHRLHRLSALNPPAEGSAEERELIEGLKGLVGLMDAVKAVELPEGVDYSALLGRGVGELELDFEEREAVTESRNGERAEGGKRDRELLGYATRRIGDFYASRLPQKTE